MTDHDPVNHPRHYTGHPSGVEAIEVTRHMTFTAGNAFKYVFRAEDKNGLEDYSKTGWYLIDTIDNSNSQVWINPTHEEVGRRRIGMVIDAEPDPDRQQFYIALCNSRLGAALSLAHRFTGAR